jgi:hypothetical protein
MLALNNGDIIQGDATNANQVDYSFYGYKNSVLTALANGQLPAVKGILYTAASADAVLSIVLVNTGAMVNNINLYYLPASSPQTSRRLIAQNLQLPAGYSLHFDGHTVTVLSNTGAVVYVGATGQGFNWRGAWVSGNNYAAYDVLTNAGNSYQCILAINNSITVPGSDPTHFSLFVSIGSTGSPGSVWYNSIGVPSGATGILGDYDLNVVNGDVYQKQGSSPSWTLVGNIRGLQGIQGPAGNIPNVIATGTSDAIIVTYTPPIVLTDLMIVAFRATAKNLTTSPSFTPNGLATLPLNKYGGQSVAIGDIPAAGADCIVQYNATSPAFWDLLNPASVGLTPATAAQIIAGSPAGVYIAPDQLALAYPAQTWQTFTSGGGLQRVDSTTYYNTTAESIMVTIQIVTGFTALCYLKVNGLAVQMWGATASQGTGYYTMQAIVPPGGSYSTTLGTGNAYFNTSTAWHELR